MCNATAVAAQAILDALSNAFKNGKIFTAFDITGDARDMTDERINHQDTRHIVHKEFADGEFPAEYLREEFLALTNGQTAICYYPDSKSAEDHPMAVQTGGASRPSARVPIPAAGTSVAPSTPIPAPKAKTGGKTKDGDGFIVNVTSEGRLNVPRELFSQVSPAAGTFDVQFNGTILYKKPIGKKNRLVMKKSDLKGGMKFRCGVDVTANTITLELV